MLDTRPLPQGKTGQLCYCCAAGAAGLAIAIVVLLWYLLQWDQAVHNRCPMIELGADLKCPDVADTFCLAQSKLSTWRA